MALLGAAPLAISMAGCVSTNLRSPLSGSWAMVVPTPGKIIDEAEVGDLLLVCWSHPDSALIAEETPPVALVTGNMEDLWSRIAQGTPGLAVPQGLEREGYSRLRQADGVPSFRDCFSRESVLLRVMGECLLAQSAAESVVEVAKAQREASELWVELRAVRESLDLLEQSQKRLETILKYARDLAMERKPELLALVEALEGERSARRMKRLEIERRQEQGLVRLRHLCGMPEDTSLQIPGDKLDDPQMGGLPTLEESLSAAAANGPGMSEISILVATLESSVVRLCQNKPGVGGRDFDNLRLDLSQQAEIATGRQHELRATLRQGAAEALASLRPLYDQHQFSKEALRQAIASAEVVERFVKERRPELGPREQLEALRAMESARHEELKLRVGYRQAMQRLDLATRPCPGR